MVIASHRQCYRPAWRGSAAAGCVLECAVAAGGRPQAAGLANDPWDEIARQQEIYDAAMALVETAREALVHLACRSRRHRRLVSCDQDDWHAIIADGFDDMVGDSFGCLPQAIARARRDLAYRDAAGAAGRPQSRL